MAKRKPEEQAPGSPAWMATFGDLMNLLLCFYVLLFSMSTINAEKLQAVAASMSQAFSIFSNGATAIGDGMLISNGVSQLNELDEYINSMGKSEEGKDQLETEKEDAVKQVEEQKLEMSEALSEKITEAVAEQNLNGEVTINFNSQYVSLTLNGGILFDSGNDKLKETALPVMQKVGKILEAYASSIVEVEGHTDNVPIHNSRFADNNELSSFRALSVFDFLVENTNLDPALIKHSGRGEYVPVADNSLPEGRSLNRRVEIKVYHELSSY